MRPDKLSGVKACVFDTYRTLFDVSGVTRRAQDALGEGWQALSDLWRTKQSVYVLAGQAANPPIRT